MKRFIEWSARMARRVQGKLGRWKCSRTPRRFQRSKSRIVQAQYLQSFRERLKFRQKKGTALCRKITGTAVLRAKNVGDLKPITKFSIKGVNLDTIETLQWCKTRQQWIHSYAMQNENFCGNATERSKVLGTNEETKIHLHWLSKILANLVKIYFSWNHWTSTPHRSETNELAERAVRGVQEGASAVLLQSGLDEKWWADSMECCIYLRNIQDFLFDGKTLTRGDSENHATDQQFYLVQWSVFTILLPKTCRDCISSVQ